MNGTTRLTGFARGCLILAGAITVVLFWLGQAMAPEIRQLGMSGYIHKYQLQGGLAVFSFTFAFPLALQLIVLAGLVNYSRQYTYVLWTTLCFAGGSVLVVLWPFIAGNQNNRYYFMLGGILLLVLIFAVGWLWAEQRQRHEPVYRRIIDLRGAGYFFFALATWNSCGMAGMPGYALYPHQALAVDAYPFIIGQTKVVMLYFILGWCFTLLSAVARKRLRRSAKINDPEHNRR